VADDTGEQLINVAREILAKRGYLGLTMKTAAAAAGVTPDVAMRYYRNRDALVAAALRLPSDPISAIPTLVAPGIEGMGERLVRYMLDILRDQQTRDELVSLARTGVNAGHAMAGLQDFLERAIVDRMTAMIGVPDARMRSALITSYLLGVAMTRYGVRLEPLASASEEEVVRMVAPVIQDLLDPRKPLPGYGRARSRAAGGAPVPGQVPPARPTRTFDPDPKATAARATRTRAASGSARQPPAPPGGWAGQAPMRDPQADATPARPKPAAPMPAGGTPTTSTAGTGPESPPEPTQPAGPAGRSPSTTPPKAPPAPGTGGAVAPDAESAAAPATAGAGRSSTAENLAAVTQSSTAMKPATAKHSSPARSSTTKKPGTAKGSRTAKATSTSKKPSTAKGAGRAAAADPAASTSGGSRSRPGPARKAPKHAAPGPDDGA
jgi:AcrR family transcriptional regulator